MLKTFTRQGCYHAASSHLRILAWSCALMTILKRKYSLGLNIVSGLELYNYQPEMTAWASSSGVRSERSGYHWIGE